MSPSRDTAVSERFWSKAGRREHDDCWNWRGCTNKDGYGTFSWPGRSILAHRIAYEIECGAIPTGLNVLHRCDNPPCCNPSHLFLGTHRENMADMRSKGRQARGERAGRAPGRVSLTEADVLAIRAAVRSGNNNLKWLSEEIGIGHLTIYDAVRGKNWKHIAGAVVPARKYSKPERHIS